jgi:hypothetical protein
MIFEDDIAANDSATIKKILKEMPLETRFKIWLEMEYLTLKIVPDREATDGEIDEASAWAQKMTNYLLDTVEEWTKDGALMRKE